MSGLRKADAKNAYLDVTYGKKPFTGYPYLLAEYLCHTFGLQKHQKLLDLGCGRGEFLKGFIDLGLDGYGFDQSDTAMHLCPDATVKVGNLDSRLPFEDNFFDVVYSKSVIEHFYYPENLIQEAFRVLKPGGLIISMTPDWKYNMVSFHSDYTHRTPFTIKSIDAIHKVVGFVDVKPERFVQLPLYWKFKSMFPLIWFVRNFIPGALKSKFKFVRFSKEVMLLCSGRTPPA